MSGIAVFNKAISTLQDSQKNLMAIGQAREKLEREKERFEFEKKKSNLEIEGLEMSNTLKKDQLETRRKMADLAMKQFQGQIDMQETMIDEEESNQQSLQEDALSTAKTVARSNPYVLAPYMTSDGGFGVKPIKTGSTKESSVDKDVANLAVRLAVQEDGDPEEYMEKARRMLGGGSSSNGVAKKTGKIAGSFNDKTETLIRTNMKHYRKSREEVINALRKKNLLIMN
jgi:hypothetical protein